MEQLREDIRQRAREVGFDAVGFSNTVSDPQNAVALSAFVEQGRHGGMNWMAETMERRAAPQTLWPEAKSIICLGLNYGPHDDPLAAHDHPDRGVISVYAQGRDYHDVVKKRLKVLARWIVETHGGEVKVFVDTAPVMEKPAAERSGLGWQGKHTNLVSREFGSWLFLGEIFTTLELAPDNPEPDHCGTCNACRMACPTGALDEDYRIDGTKCISYLTIEHKGLIEPELMDQMGNRIYGCDDCLAVCPWNKYAAPTKEDAFFARPETTSPRLMDFLRLDDPAFRQVYAGSPVKRTGRDRMVRNALIAAGNSGDPTFLASVRALQNDPADVVRQAARWAEVKLTQSADKSEG